MSDPAPDGGVPPRADQQPSSLLPTLPPRVEPSQPDPFDPEPALGQTQPPPPLVQRPTFEYEPIAPLAPGQLPRGMFEVSPWARLGAYLLDAMLSGAILIVPVLAVVVLDANVAQSIVLYLTGVLMWCVWAISLGTGGQTPAKRLLGHTVIAADTHLPVGLGRMFWVRGILCGFVAPIIVVGTLGIVLFMPFWNKHNQNIWDRISHCYVAHRP